LTEGSGFGHDASTRNRGAFLDCFDAFASCDAEIQNVAANSTARIPPAATLAALIGRFLLARAGDAPDEHLSDPVVNDDAEEESR